jgi:segregation and condensation protein B
MTELARILEALLFLSSDPVSVEDLAEACEVEAAAVAEAIDELRAEFAQGRRGLLLREVAGGFTLASDPIAETAARRLLAKPRIASLTPAQMETLAIVAYLQPISRPEMARIRGVNADSPVGSLLDRGLIEESGRSSFGAVMYRTTPLFLKLFGLQDTSALPDVAEWDPSPEEQAELRDRLLRAGEARAGIGSPPSEAAPEAVGSDGQ